jgi:hypothetical protein
LALDVLQRANAELPSFRRERATSARIDAVASLSMHSVRYVRINNTNAHRTSRADTATEPHALYAVQKAGRSSDNRALEFRRLAMV